MLIILDTILHFYISSQSGISAIALDNLIMLLFSPFISYQSSDAEHFWFTA